MLFSELNYINFTVLGFIRFIDSILVGMFSEDFLHNTYQYISKQAFEYFPLLIKKYIEAVFHLVFGINYFQCNHFSS